VGEESTTCSIQCASPYSCWSQSHCTTIKQKSLSNADICRSWSCHPGRYFWSICDFWCEAGPNRFTDTQQNLLSLFTHNQGTGSKHASTGCYTREEYTPDRLWEVDGWAWATCGRIWKICWFGRHGQHPAWSWTTTFGSRASHTIYAHRTSTQLQELIYGSTGYKRCRVWDSSGYDAEVHWPSDFRVHRQWECVSGRTGNISRVSTWVCPTRNAKEGGRAWISYQALWMSGTKKTSFGAERWWKVWPRWIWEISIPIHLNI